MRHPTTLAEQGKATPLHIAFLIRSLERGGSERQLVELARRLPKDQFRVSVITFYGGGAMAGDIEGQPGIRRYSLEKRGRWDLVGFLFRCWSLLRQLKPDILHGYLGTANELSLLCGRLIGARIVWGIRASNVDLARYDWLSATSFRAAAWLSRCADAIIANSYAGRAYHVAHGYSGRRMVVIPNGIDTDRYRPEPRARQRIRRAWGVGDDDVLIGIVARLDPMKDHSTFLHAANLLARAHTTVRFVCVGDGPAEYRQTLQRLTEQLALSDRLLWVGPRDDMADVYPAFDIATSSSAFGEGFSNAIGEAMACGVLCVVTDVGDAAVIVQDAARIVPPGDPVALSAAWARMLRLSPAERIAMAETDRARVTQAYNSAVLVERTASVLSCVRRRTSRDVGK